MIDKEKNIDVENKNIKKSCCNKGKKTKDVISTILVILVVLSFIIPGLNKNESIDYASDYYDAVNKEIIDANEYEIAYFTKRGPDFIERSTVKPYEESNFIILTDNDIDEEPQLEM